MQKIATRLFIYASIAFGVAGIVMILSAPAPRDASSDFHIFTEKLLGASVFVILPSFALSVASKYLDGKF